MSTSQKRYVIFKKFIVYENKKLLNYSFVTLSKGNDIMQ